MTTSNRDREVCDAATDGPWNTSYDEFGRCLGIWTGDAPDIDPDIVVTDCGVYPPCKEDAEFITHFSPTRVRAMLDELDAAKEAIVHARFPLLPSVADAVDRYTKLRDAREGKL